MYKSAVYKGEELLGEVEIYPQQQQEGEEENHNNKKRVIDEILTGKEIRISHFSQPSERCPPLAVIHTITCGMCFKMESKNTGSLDTPLHLLHSSCIQENKTAIMPIGGEELHLVAMYSRNDERLYPCFWGFNVSAGLYNACLVMLNLRCLGIVFDLDETLIVANTMRSFEDRIEALQRKISTEMDPQRISGMLSEVKRYQDDKTILKQYVENDQFIENGRVIKTQLEIVPALSDNHQPIVRPLIRLQERNIILTRINPQIRDTSVLVRLRPAWEELRSYLTARGRKRFEVYVCTMAERDYALEMWRLLDPESNLINSKELLDRIVCVKSGSRKSLFNVFQDGICHPKMALVIDDRLKVWDEKDQPRVHVVPAFAPYYAPQAEANNTVPVLCVARNVACNVRGGFFKEFDEGLLQRIPEISYEDDMSDIPSPPDVSNYLVSEDDAATSNGHKDPLLFDGMADAEVEKRLKEALSASSMFPSTVANVDSRLVPPLQYTVVSSSSSTPVPAAQPSVMPFPSMQFPQATSLVKPLAQVGPPEPSLQSSPAREEGEVPESELDPDTRRRLLILQHGQDTRDHAPSETQFPVRPSMQVSTPRVQSCGSWVPVEEEMSPRQLNRATPRGFSLDSEPVHIEKHRPHHTPFFPKVENSIPSERMLHENQRLPKVLQAPYRDDRLRINHTMSNYHSFSGEEIPLSRPSSSNRDLDFESERAVRSAETPVGVLQEIAMKCGAKAWFAGEKVGEGIGRTRREAQHLAAEVSVKNLAISVRLEISPLPALHCDHDSFENVFPDIYMAQAKPDNGALHGDASRYSSANENGYLGNLNSFGSQTLPKDEPVSSSSASEPSRFLDPRLEGSKKSMGSVTALKELCMTEGLGVNFLAQTPLSSNSGQKDEVHAQVEIDGQVMGKGIGSTWDEAKMQAAEKALRTMYGQFPPKRQGSPRPMQGMSNKRLKVLQRMPSSARYPKNAPPVP
ncbi:RNA polymerase II C-terminal domain phosphatase-like 1 isoform X3 [Hevea brasiliensis]|uniref:RNA polymerase II C-terminal domain phosphatase-like 1 isoform X3 n=1 Tax=Hevea brasiliensis TaxID=3981 RepID=UPI0025F50372|nr:RNA polymerase II C-terminal domain phosphatase-like 1 isoform X3 [Hevea brasiliensis]